MENITIEQKIDYIYKKFKQKEKREKIIFIIKYISFISIILMIFSIYFHINKKIEWFKNTLNTENIKENLSKKTKNLLDSWKETLKNLKNNY